MTNIYFIQGSPGSPVKIGNAVHPHLRISQLQTGSWDTLKIVMLICNCEEEIERLLHKHFSRKHIRGEWFDASVMNDISDLRDAIRLSGFRYERVVIMCPFLRTLHRNEIHAGSTNILKK